MAGKKKVATSDEIQEKAVNTKAATKKIATGSTKKIVQKRSSSVASKKQATTTTKRKTTKEKEEQSENEVKKTTKKNTKPKAETAKKTTTKTTTTKTEKEPTKTATKKTTTKKSTTTTKGKLKSEKELDEKIDVLDNETKENFSSIIKMAKQNKNLKEEENEKQSEEEEIIINEAKNTQPKKKAKQLSMKEMAKIEEAVVKEMKANKKMPEVELKKMATRIFQNVFLAIIVMIYMNFVILGFQNIENSVFLVDLKVFSVAILVIAIIVIEHAYKKESGRHAIHGIETLILSFVTMALIYVDLTCMEKFIPISILIAYVFAIYYVAKSIIVYRKMKKRYFVETMKEIIRR